MSLKAKSGVKPGVLRKEAERVQLSERRTGRVVLSPPVSAKAAAGLACAKATFQAGMRQSRISEMTGPHALFS
jgi:hypothetical protein